MTNARAWPVRAMYILIAAALAIGLLITAAPAHKVSAATGTPTAEWATVSTPTTSGWVLAPGSTIYDYALASEGSKAYAVVQAYAENQSVSTYAYRLLKSITAGATWTDLTSTLSAQVTKDGYTLTTISQVATDWINPDFVAVALTTNATGVYVYFSTDGGTTFVSAGSVSLKTVADLIVSPAVSGVRDIAIGGDAKVFRSTVTVSSETASAWTDTTTYTGWDVAATTIVSTMVTDLIFSPNWATDKTILVTTVADSGMSVYLQSGTWGKTTGAWNAAAGFAPAVPVKQSVPIATPIAVFNARGVAGIALPNDYDGSNTAARYAWVWVNYISSGTLPTPTGEIIMVNDSVATPINQQVAGNPWLTNVSYLGTIAQGKAIAGVMGNGIGGLAIGCQGVRVYHNGTVANMNICCEPWQLACKLPTGTAGMAVSYVDANNAGSTHPDKAYAVALFGGNGRYSIDESAWSVSVDGDGLVWNQISLVNTQIDYLSDVAVSPVCNKMMLVSVNTNTEISSGCDSVWLMGSSSLPEAPEYTGYWVRTWCGQLTYDWGLLRLAPASVETTGDNVYLVDYGTDTVYYNDMETWDCWKSGASTITTASGGIVDLAVKDASTIYAVGKDGTVAMSDNYGKAVSWTTPVDSGVTTGYTIAVHGDYILVGGENGDVAYSSDGGTTFTSIGTTTPITGYVTVAFDTYFDTNNVIYAAVDGGAPAESGGIYYWTIGTSTSWTGLGAANHAYTGLVLSNINGNSFTSAATGGVLYASYVTALNSTGVARCLTPLVGQVACSSCKALWDYLTYDLPSGVGFEAWPEALKACGCTTPDTYTNLYAIDAWSTYDMVNGEPGAVWTFEDCYAKRNVTLVSPADGYVVGTSSCGCCNVPFTVKWDPLCDSCYYDIQFALDAAFTQPVELTPQTGSSLPPTISGPYSGIDGTYYSVSPQNGANPTEFLGCYFQPQTTYYWRMRAAGTGNQEIHSWWSKAQSFTVSPTAAAGAIELVAPAPGATDVAVTNVAFSWHLLATADSFDFVLSKNADLSSPILSKTALTGTATSYTGTQLSYDTAYYWQVTAYYQGAEISKSAIGTFRTVAQTVTPPVTTPTTPVWVWVVIAIGAVLVIVVIVLIFRTRRV